MAAEENAIRPPPYAEESIANMYHGAAILAQMVRSNLFSSKPSMPPPRVFEWYVRHVLFQFIEVEHHVVNRLKPTEEDNESLTATLMELSSVQEVLAHNQQFGLASEIENALRVRKLSLPDNYDSSYGGQL